MEAIIYGIVAVSLVICLVLMFYYGRWALCKRIKPAYVRRNVVTFGWVQAVVLITAMLINGIIMDVRGVVTEFDSNQALLIVLLAVMLSFFFALMCRETLLKNYLSGVNIGDKCQFVVATVFEQRLEGYVVVGNNKGKFGFATGKSGEVPDAIKKAVDKAKRNLIDIEIVNGGTLAHEIIGKFGATNVFLKPAPEGTGIIAGGPVRAILELAGVKNIYSKVYGSRTKINIIRATASALKNEKDFNKTMALRKGGNNDVK